MTIGGAKVAEDEETIVGENVLGRLLMELRERLKQDASDQLLTVEPLAIPDFLMMGMPIHKVVARAATPTKPQNALF